MALLSLPTVDVEQTALRPIVLDVVRDLIEIMGLSKDTRILFPGDIGVAQHVGTSIQPENNNPSSFPFSSQLQITVREDYVEDQILASAVHRRENRLLFEDQLLPVRIWPGYAQTEVSVNIRYRAVDKVSAFKWRQEMRARASANRQQLVHEVDFSFLLHPYFHNLLKEIHRLREKSCGYGETIEQWFQKCLTKRATIETTLAATEPMLSFREEQCRVQGWFDFAGRPEQGAGDDGGATWTTSFTYTFRYDKPDACVMSYPIMIHQSLLSSQWRNDKPSNRENFHQQNFPISLQYLHRFESGYDMDKMAYKKGIAIPKFDDFVIYEPNRLPSTTDIFTVLISLDPENPNLLMNLEKDLGHYVFDSGILDFMKKEAPFMTKRYGSVFQVMLYKGPYLMDPTKNYLKVDKDLNVLARREMGCRDVYHINVSLVTDLNLLDDDAKDRLREDACVLGKVISAIDPSIDLSRIKPINGECGYVPRDQLDPIIDDINSEQFTKGDLQKRQFNTVETFFVDTKDRRV